jgi:hypothetical protein
MFPLRRFLALPGMTGGIGIFEGRGGGRLWAFRLLSPSPIKESVIPNGSASWRRNEESTPFFQNK